MPFSVDLQYDGLFSDCVEEGQAFRLLDARNGGLRDTEFGEGQKTTHLLVECPSGPKWLSLFGDAINREVAGLVPSDFPKMCVIYRGTTRRGTPVKLLRPAEKGDPRADVKDPVSANKGPDGKGGYGQQPNAQDPGEDDIQF